jgi:hypothetical protein
LNERFSRIRALSHTLSQVVGRKIEFSTPWFQLISNRVAGESAPCYSLRMQDYVSVVAFTDKHELVPERGVERILVPRANLAELLAKAEFDRALHVAALMLVVLTRPGTFDLGSC